MTALLRRGLSVTAAVFISGAVLLGVEIAASRVLAPFFGNSLYVWGSLIGVVLAGLSVGYLIGGHLADRWPRPTLLVAVILLGGTGVIVIPVIDGHVLEWVVSWDPGPRLNPLIASVALFGLPSIVLAAVTPIAIRLRASKLAELGSTAGSLFSISTLGSITGVFATAFWLIPELGTDQLVAVGGVALFVAAATVALAERQPVAIGLCTLAVAGATVLAIDLAPDKGGKLEGAAARNWSPVYRLRTERFDEPPHDYIGYDVLYRKDTEYHRLAVVEDDTQRTLRFDSSFQSAMSLKDPYATEYDYTDYLQLGLAYNPRAKNMLFVGLGGGSAPKRVWRDFPSLRLQAVEIDPVVVEVAHRFFEVPKSPRLGMAVQDGRRYLATHKDKWDVIVLDTFYGDGVPFHMTTNEFLELARTRLAPGGVIVTNLIGSVVGPGSQLFRAIYRTYRTVFPTVAVHPVLDSPRAVGNETLNLILVSTESPAPRESFLIERWRQIRAKASKAVDLTIPIRNRMDRVIPIRDVPTLTDDYAPTDSLLLG